jgi:signal transduction histidine kinase
MKENANFPGNGVGEGDEAGGEVATGVLADRTEGALLESEHLYRSLFANLLNGFAYCRILVEEGIPWDFIPLAVNETFELQTGLKDIVGRRITEVVPGIRLSDPQLIETCGRVALTGRPERFEVFVKSLQEWFAISVYSPAPKHFVALLDVITQRKRAEAYRDMGREVLQILNEPGELLVSVDQALSVLQARTGFDAVGMRLQEGDDFPYFGQAGFPVELLLAQASLVATCPGGRIVRDQADKTGLQCTCGLVLSGRSDPDNPHFTAAGSFWCNNYLPFMVPPPDRDFLLHPRTRCVHAGYASVALIPIRNEGRIVGLLQFNDRRPGCFNLDTVELLEGIAAQVATVLMRKQDEKEKIQLEEQLRHAQKMESVGRLAGGVAHDFNNMLSVIIGHANLGLALLAPDQPLHSSMEEILTAAQRSAELTRQLLAFARKQTIAPRVIDLSRIVSGIFKMLKRLIGEQIELVWNERGDLWPVKVDPSQIDQILANLCVNASDSITGYGKIFLETGNCLVDEGYCACNPGVVPGSYVRLSVSDSGCGMDKETRARIFEPFFTTKDVGAGTGLGLATVYGIVKQNQGFINVYSEPGLGTTFSVYLPRHVGQAEPVASLKVPHSCHCGGETILVVEDEPAILKVTAMILSRQGYTVLQAGSPRGALRLAREHGAAIDLLVTDVVMPGMNGLELAKRLQALYPGLKRLFMSGYTADVIANNGVLDEGLQFIHKPFSVPDLAAKVREVLDSI